jgi:hypothetical protein
VVGWGGVGSGWWGRECGAMEGLGASMQGSLCSFLGVDCGCVIVGLAGVDCVI